MRFKRLNDDQWEFIKPRLPPSAKTGRHRADDRMTIDAILYVLKTGIPWNDLPEDCGDDVTAWRRLKRWERQGVWKRILDALIAEGYSRGKLSMDALSIDSDTIPAKKGERRSATMGIRGSRAPRSMPL